jgi:dihydropteroate synthase
MDEQMIETVAALHIPYVLMHMQGTPQTMQTASAV